MISEVFNSVYPVLCILLLTQQTSVDAKLCIPYTYNRPKIKLLINKERKSYYTIK